MNISPFDPGDRPLDNCTIFLGFTSNMISSGVRETIKFLLANNMVGFLEIFMRPFCEVSVFSLFKIALVHSHGLFFFNLVYALPFFFRLTV